jgi:hypothetical protein
MQYKHVVRIEQLVWEEIKNKMQMIIDKYAKELRELKDAIKIPRQYYKLREDMKY